MKLVYTHENRFFVNNAKNIVEAENISCFIKNEFAAGGAGDLAPLSAWLELWVFDDDDYARALDLVTVAFEATPSGSTSWLCHHCQENNEGSFEICWSCGTERRS